MSQAQVESHRQNQAEGVYETQGDLILEVVGRMNGRGHYPSAWDVASTTGMLITSVRRALHGLESESLVRVAGAVNGPMGRPVSVYQVITPEGQGDFFGGSYEQAERS